MIYFRADSNSTIATGHIFRCLSLAQAARRNNIDCKFITADHRSKELIEGSGFEYICLETDYDCMSQEIDSLKKLAAKSSGNILIIDSYYVTEEYLYEVSKSFYTCYIDDLNSFVYPVNCVINYSNYADSFNYAERYPKGTLLLTGTVYAPLRDNFASLPEKKIGEKVKNLLLLAGGSNNLDIFNKFLDKLFSKETSDTVAQIETINIVCGKFDLYYEALCNNYASEEKVHIYRNLPTLLPLMQEADICITAGGSTLYELSACGTPSITYSFADNQFGNCHSFDSDGLMPYAGDFRYENVPSNVVSRIEELGSPDIRKKISAGLQAKVDGCGASNLIRDLMKSIGD